jgi:DNA ligase-1
MTQFKPMLAGKAPDDLSTLKFPLALSWKLDGIRALVKDGVVMSRSLKPIPNRHVQKLFSTLEGYDGELIVGSPTDVDCFNKTTSGVMTRDGEPDVYYHVFDHHNLLLPWKERFELLHEFDKVVIVPHHDAWNVEDIIEFEEDCLSNCYEGAMIRSFSGPYKNGRSTTREGWLLKLKRFEDSEALVIGMEEKLHNGNEATIGELGQTKRTSHQENLVPMGTMGALIVRDLKTGVVFNIGTGFSDADRDWWWRIGTSCATRNSHIKNNGGMIMELMRKDLIVNYTYFATGSKDKPRFPTMKGIRHKDDLS